MENLISFDIKNIYTLVEKQEDKNFYYKNESRLWDGFILVTDGEVDFKTKKQALQTVEKGGIIFLSRGEEYYVKSKNGCSYITTAYDFTSDSKKTLSEMPSVCECNAVRIKIIEEITEKWQRKLSDSFMVCKIELLKLYLDFIKKYTAGHSLVNDKTVALAIKFIHENFKRNFKTREIAKYCSASESHLRLKFLKQTGKTITEYRDDLRIKSAKELLSSGFFSVKETAYELGFCDVYYFTKFFSSFTGITPAKYIKENTKLKQNKNF